jgi:hypothetical protein
LPIALRKQTWDFHGRGEEGTTKKQAAAADHDVILNRAPGFGILSGRTAYGDDLKTPRVVSTGTSQCYDQSNKQKTGPKARSLFQR